MIVLDEDEVALVRQIVRLVQQLPEDEQASILAAASANLLEGREKPAYQVHTDWLQ
jgi:hypothetical protein